ncbi:MAG TPA: hypothetical protein VL484_11925 [Vicinamibacterales bacterium]|nr:hypothetical protein [Vicinamibacterales bacterium]
MEQRPLRLGDIVDDYCPRERRVTDHAVVAMIEDAIKQTRCTACDTEHPYKGGKAPRRKNTPTTGRLYKEVLAGIKDADGPPADDGEPTIAASSDEAIETESVEEAASEGSLAVEALEAAEPPDDTTPLTLEETGNEPEGPIADEGPVHRPLIRATLPRPDGVKVERPIPEFTIRHNGNGRPHGNGNFRDARGGGKPRGSGQQRFNRGPGGGGGGARHGRGGPGFGTGRPGGGGSRRRGR